MKNIQFLSLGAGLMLITLISGCQSKPEITSSPTAAGKVGQPFSYQIAATENPTKFGANVPPPNGLSVNVTSGQITGTPTDAGNFSVQMKASNDRGEGTKTLNLSISPASGPGSPAPRPFHAVVPGKELLITAPEVLTNSRAKLGGAWHIRSAMKRMVGSGDVDAFAQAWFSTWADNVAVSGITDSFTARPWVADELRSAWAANRIELIAIVNRLDLTRFPDGNITNSPTSLGEGRFIYEVRDASGIRLPFSLIFEYRLPSPSGNLRQELGRWATNWHALGRPQLGGPDEFGPAYLAELQTLTDEYSSNGLQLNQIRSNEFLLAPDGQRREWELREFHFESNPNRLTQVGVAVTPAFRHNAPTAPGALAGFINANEASILARGVDSVPPNIQGAVSPVPVPPFPPASFRWTSTGVNSDRALFITSFNTCSGCHAGNTKTFFQHVGAVAPTNSPFLNGIINLDHALPGRSTTQHNEMKDRADALSFFAKDISPSPTEAVAADSVEAIIKSRANRTH